MVITYKGIEMVSITEAARMMSRSVQTLRYMLEDRPSRKGMTHFKDGCHVYLPVKVMQGYQYGEPGVVSPIGHNVYHFIDDGTGRLRKTYCQACTITKEGCALYQEAQEVIQQMKELGLCQNS